MDKKKKYTWGMIIIAIILILPLVLAWLIPKQSFIKDFTESNDWIGFWGSYIGAIVTLVVLWFTREDTRKIQSETKEMQKESIRLEKLREQKIFAYDIAEDIAKYLAETNEYFEEEGNSRKLSKEVYFLLQIKLNRVSGFDFLDGYAYKILNIMKLIEKSIDESDVQKFDKYSEDLIKATKLFIGVSKST